MNVASLLECRARELPDRTAIIDYSSNGATITFAELDCRAKALASHLRDRHLPGDAFAIFVPMSIDLYVAIAGVLYAGCVVAICDPHAGHKHVASAMKRIRPRGVIASAKGHMYATSVPALLPLPRYRVPRRAGGAVCQIVDRADDDTAVLSLTSGSTSLAKVVVRSHSTLRGQLERLLDTISLSSPSIATMPLVMLANLASGVTSIIPSLDLGNIDHESIADLGKQVEISAATSLVASPAILEGIVKYGNSVAFRSIEHIASGGAPVMPSLLQRVHELIPQARITSVYGSTEAEPIATIAFSDVSTADLAAMRDGAGLLAGYPIRGCDIRLIGERDGRGEIVVAGPHVVRGYLDGVGDSETKIREESQIWHRTGDLGRFDTRGRLWLLGRLCAASDSFQPLAIECALSFDKRIARAAALQRDGKRLIVIEANPEEGSNFVKPAGVDEVRVVARIPVDRRHFAKVDYPALKRMLEGSA